MTDTAEIIRDGYIARRSGDSEKAAKIFTEAVDICRRENDSKNLILALKGAAQIERDTNHAEKALPLYEEAVELCRGGKDSRLLAHTIRHLADLNQDLHRMKPAESGYLEALALYRGRLGTPSLELANAIRPFGILRAAMGDPKEARKLLAEARELYAQVNIDEGVKEMSKLLADLE